MLVFPQMDPTNSRSFLRGKFIPRGPPAFKMEMKQQEPQEKEIPIWAIEDLKISRKHHPQRHQPYDLPTWGQITTLTNQVKNLISQQGMPQSPENLLNHYALLACTTPTQAGLTNLLTQPPFITGHKMNGEKTDGINQ